MMAHDGWIVYRDETRLRTELCHNCVCQCVSFPRLPSPPPFSCFRSRVSSHKITKRPPNDPAHVDRLFQFHRLLQLTMNRFKALNEASTDSSSSDDNVPVTKEVQQMNQQVSQQPESGAASQMMPITIPVTHLVIGTVPIHFAAVQRNKSMLIFNEIAYSPGTRPLTDRFKVYLRFTGIVKCGIYHTTGGRSGISGTYFVYLKLNDDGIKTMVDVMAKTAPKSVTDADFQ